MEEWERRGGGFTGVGGSLLEFELLIPYKVVTFFLATFGFGLEVYYSFILGFLGNLYRLWDMEFTGWTGLG